MYNYSHFIVCVILQVHTVRMVTIMIGDKKIIGACIAGIHNNAQISYLNQLYRYARENDYKLLIFNSFADSKNQNSFHDDAGAVYGLINFHLIDALVIHEQSMCSSSLTEALYSQANAQGVSILPEELFLSDSFRSEDLQTPSADRISDTVFDLRHAMMDSILHEDFMYEWLSKVLTIRDIKDLDTLLAEVILYDSYLCLNHNIIDLILHNASQDGNCFSENPIVISSQPIASDTDLKTGFPLSDMIPHSTEWLTDNSAYILSTVHVDGKIYGYYALRTDNFTTMASPLKRVNSALNLAFRIVSNEFRHTDMSLSIKQAMLTDTDKHLPLNLLIEKNLFFYHFQPIADAHNGTIFAYEALMRTDPVIYMSPLEVLNAASAYGRLYDIEKATMQNTLAYISEHEELFEDCKLFVNSIPAHMLNAADWSAIVNKYGHLLDKLVIEMTEQTEMDNDRITVIRNRLKAHNISLAIDDYGTGFSNISNLIRYAPNYVKIDRSLIENIQEKPKMQKLVAGIIEFVHENGFYALAEGVETHEELKTMIALGSDLIQGYYIAKPASYILRELPESLRDEIVELNRMRSGYEIKVYCPKEDEVVDLARITAEHYNAILIETEHVTVQGVPGTAINCSIAIRDGLHTHITLKDVYITTEKEGPLLDLGNFTNATVILEGDNEIINRGIRVPQSSDFHLTGEGSLHIHSEMLNSYGIGNDMDNSYGNIWIDFIGQLHIDISGENSVAVGGGKNDAGSIISIHQTKVQIECSGNNCVGIGNFDGNCIIDIKKSKDILNVSGANAVGIGCISGNANILIDHHKISVTESGIGLCGIGVLRGGAGRLIASHGSIACDLRGRNIVCFGTDGGSLDCSTFLTSTDFYCEGNSVTGIGDINGSGNIYLRDSNLTMRILARDNLDIGSKYGKLETINIQKQIKVNE
ncbi:MAG: EAL domain-containing protein [Lachnospiraceae bacterium]|nr:EAL domain-containing protein [Lachnospiraceae bacterium]